jgi:methyltransferase (TIGR00027 family)
MSEKKKEQKPSGTALFTTLTRAIAYEECNDGNLGRDCFAGVFLPFHIRMLLKSTALRTKLKHTIPCGMYEYMLSRTAYFDDVFEGALKKNAPQIVILGAGYDTRAYRFARVIKDTKIIELDAPLIQAGKRQRLRRARIPVHDNVLFASTNFDAEPLGVALEKAGYRRNENCLFLLEGLVYYLKPESVDAMLGFIGGNRSAENTVVFDYILSVPFHKITDYYGATELFLNHIKKFPDEKGGFFIEEDAMTAYLAQRGLHIADTMNNRDMETRFLSHTVGLATSRVTGWFRFVAATTQNGQLKSAGPGSLVDERS